ncbi:hypothetical protein ZWY2020_000461 [Hordeum vulgare]|nr:hypothetical protein ZWY2020_000461 [Hordeum vulgare]
MRWWVWCWMEELRDFLRVTAQAALLLDFFCYSVADVAAEIGIPTYFFFLGCTASLAVSGVTPIPAHDLPGAFLDRSSLSYKHFLAMSQQLCQSHGVIVNSCRSLEPRATDVVAAGLCAPGAHDTAFILHRPSGEVRGGGREAR